MDEPLHPDPGAPELDGLAMARLAAGEAFALNEIMERWRSRLLTYLLRFTGNESTALDLAEETFVQVYLARTKFQVGKAFPAWLFGIASNLARNHLRWRRRHPSHPVEEADQIAAGADPSQTTQSKERQYAVRAAIAALPEELRDAILFSEYEGFSHAEIAAITGCSAKAVERRLSKARELLRKQLSRSLRS
jgi:RNA polymerase sigma-70 factor (ECF subfamily)